MHDQIEIRLAEALAARVRVGQRVIQILLGHRIGPSAYHTVEKAPMRGERCEIAKRLRGQITLDGQPAHRIECRMAGRMIGKALQPDHVGNGDVSERAVDGAEERAAVRHDLFRRQRRRRRVDFIVHPAIVGSHLPHVVAARRNMSGHGMGLRRKYPA